MHCARMSSVDVSLVGAKRRDLELETGFQHDDDAKMRTNCVGARKKLLHGFRRSVSGDVEILWRFAANDVAHATASEISDMAVVPQTCGNLACCLFHQRKSSLFHVFTVAAVCDRRILNNADTAGELPALQFLGSRCRSFTSPKRMNNKQDDCNRDAGIGDVERRPGMRVWNVQIEEEKID